MTDKRICMHCLHCNSISRDIPPSLCQCTLIGCGVKWDDSCGDWKPDDPEERKRLRRERQKKNRGYRPLVRGTPRRPREPQPEKQED